ncbi:13202_t:CDS:2 [Dentiscutata heterogama]|uniref:13202_t:CDS:1 n=1 Tax=Dentiscutata heterogama TaxID=1316150 RepID=A0ACA9NJS4_9GLOM|nr:13202_t:CDS:2 [Dentiscutata heterogama]
MNNSTSILNTAEQRVVLNFDFKNKDEAVRLFAQLLQRCRDLEGENKRQEIVTNLSGFDFPQKLIEDAKIYLETTNFVSAFESDIYGVTSGNNGVTTGIAINNGVTNGIAINNNDVTSEIEINNEIKSEIKSENKSEIKSEATTNK